MDQGRLPGFLRLVESGSSGVLDPNGLAGPMLWPTVATGVMPAVHGILGALELRADVGGVQPVGARSWHAPPVWQVAAEAGMAAAAIGIPGTSPATAWPGCCVVDDRYAAAPTSEWEDWPPAPGCIAPVRLREALRPLRVHPGELDAAARGGLPAGPLAAAVSIHAAAAHVAEHEDWRLLTVYYGLLAADGSDAAYEFQDAMLQRLMHLAGPGADTVVVSASGVLIAAGPGFARDAVLHGAGPADVAATVLARLGLRRPGAAGRVLDGTRHGPLRDCAATPRPAPAPVPAGSGGPPPGQEAARLVAEVEHHALVQRGLAALAGGDHAAAALPLRAALAVRPDDLSALLLLGQCAVFLGDHADGARIGRRLAAARPDLPWGAMLAGASLALAGDDPGAAPLLAEAAALAGADPQAHVRLGALHLHLGRPADAEGHYRRALALDAALPEARAGLGLVLVAVGDAAGAEVQLRLALGLRYHAPALHLQLGTLQAAQGRLVEAAASLRAALAQHPGLPGAAAGLRRVEDAVARRAGAG